MRDEASASGTRVTDRIIGPVYVPETDSYNTVTRQFCHRCHHVVEVDFYSPIWRQVTGRHWQNSILCVRCFAEIGDEKHIAWEEGIKFEPCSYATDLAQRDEH